MGCPWDAVLSNGHLIMYLKVVLESKGLTRLKSRTLYAETRNQTRNQARNAHVATPRSASLGVYSL